MANLKHIGEGKKLLLKLLAQTRPGIKHWIKQHPIKAPSKPPTKPQ